MLIPRWSDDASAALGLTTNVQANLALAIYGLLLIAVVLLAPRGIAGIFGRAAHAVRTRWESQQMRRHERRGEVG